MPFAYSRDPALLFQAPPGGFAPPLNFESILYNGVQPVRYEKKILLQSIGDFKQKNEVIEVVDIDWISGNLTAYYNAEEAMNGIVAYNMDKFRIPCHGTKETAFDYVKETLSLLRRGHSLLHPLCTCTHDLSPSRCQTLGISFLYSDYNKRRQEIPCSLSRRPREFSAKEVSEELGIEDIILFKTHEEGKFLIHILNHHCNIRIDGMNLFLSCKDFVLNLPKNKNDLLLMLSKNPLTISLHRDQMYPGFLDDIHELVKNNIIYQINNNNNNTEEIEDEGIITLFYFNPRWNIEPVDKDIRSLWHSCVINYSREPSSLTHCRLVEGSNSNKHKKKRKTSSSPIKKNKTPIKKPKRNTFFHLKKKAQ